MEVMSNRNVHCSYSSSESKTCDFDVKSTARLLEECNVVKYAAYRTAAKLRCLQKLLQMDHVRLGLVAGVFFRHQLQASENEVMLDLSELEAVLSDIYFAAQKEALQDIKVDLVTAKMLDLLFQIHGGTSRDMIQVISAKVTLVVLSCAKLQEKYQYFFHQLADHNNCMPKRKVELLLTNLTRITEYLSESPSFGLPMVPATVESCLQQCQGTLGVTEDGFIEWLRRDPQLLVWMSTLYRLQAAETVCHGVKCAVCKIYPISGLRYKCLRCLKYNQCQMCFFTGKLSKRHKLKHPMQEYCCETSSKEATVAFLRTIRNKLCKNTSKSLNYLPVPANSSVQSNEETKTSLSSSCMTGSNQDLSSRTVLNGSRVTVQPQNEIQSIICNLEDENRHLQEELKQLCVSGQTERVEACLKDHRAQIEAQVERLKSLKAFLSQAPQPQLRHHQMESTPIVPTSPRKRYCGLPSIPDLESISPITRDNEIRRLTFNQMGSSTATNLPSLSERSISDLSTWVHNKNTDHSREGCSGLSLWLQNPHNAKPTLEELHGDLDSVIQKLQEMLASNFNLDESFSSKDNAQLQQAATEMEDLLAGLIQGVEQRKKLS